MQQMEYLKLTKNNRLDEIKALFPADIARKLFYEKHMLIYEKLQEIRLRIARPIIIQYDNNEIIYPDIVVTQSLIDQCLEYICEYSLYAYQEDLRQGFITVKGGHRVGLIGKAVMEAGEVKNQKFISFINIRVAHQVIGCADSVMDFVCKNHILKHTLIISPPGCGKTTMLRDIVRQLSNGCILSGKRVCIVDERSEIAACYEGCPQNDVGLRTDVLDCCYKANGMLMLLRSMSPEIIAIDEIGGESDTKAIEYIINGGCFIIATVHGNSYEELLSKPDMRTLLGKGIFSRIIVLSKQNGIGQVKELIEI